MTTTKTQFENVLAELAAAFVADKRDDGKTFYKLKDDAPAWLEGSDVMLAIHSALDDRLPCDWVYEQAASIAENLGGYDCDDADDAREHMTEIAGGLVDVYYSDLTAWLADHTNNALICDESAAEFGGDGDTFSRIGAGQYMAIERIGRALISEVENEADDRDDA
jgi:hypothetical protein